MKKLLQSQTTEYLKTIYFDLMVYDNRLPELFDLMAEKKLRKYLIEKLLSDCTKSDLQDYL